MISQERIEFYHREGYVGMENVLPDEDLAALRQVTDEFLEKSRNYTENNTVYDLEPGHTPKTPKLRRLKNPVQQHETYDRILRHPAILDIVEQLLGPDIYTNGDKLNMKLPEFGSPVEWHQDWAFYPHTNDDMLAVGVAMDDMLQVNGCLQVLPGSHKRPILDHHFEGHFAGMVTDQNFDDSDAVPIEVHAGGISIHHVRALHGSLPNLSDIPRRLLLLQYCAADSWCIYKTVDWEAHLGQFVRGEPTNQPRLENVPVRLPLPPVLRSGSIYEAQSIVGKSNFGNADAERCGEMRRCGDAEKV
jgi:phytanoyl-CoA hydroxylase